MVDPLTFQTIMSDVEEPSKIKTWFNDLKNYFASTSCCKKSTEIFAKVKMWFQEFKNCCCVSTSCCKTLKEMFISETKKEDEIR